MKSRNEIEDLLNKLDVLSTKFPAMNYEQGVSETLLWIIGDLDDEEDFINQF